MDIFIDGADGGWQAEIFNFTDSKEEMMVKVIVDTDTDRVLKGSLCHNHHQSVLYACPFIIISW